MAPLDLVVDFQVSHSTAILAAPAVALQDLLPKAAV